MLPFADPRLAAASFAVSLFAAAVVPLPAHASAAEAPTRIVRIADLDLGQPADRKLLEKRIKSAARYVCMTGNDSAARAAEEACIRDTLARIATTQG